MPSCPTKAVISNLETYSSQRSDDRCRRSRTSALSLPSEQSPWSSHPALQPHPAIQPVEAGGLKGMSSAWYGLSDLLLVERRIDGKFSWPANDGMQTRRGMVSYGCAA